MTRRLTLFEMLFFALSYCLAIGFGRHLSIGPDPSPPLVWPASGLYFGFLLITQVRDWWKIVVIALFCGLIGNFLSEIPIHPDFLFIWILRTIAMLIGVFLLQELLKKSDEDSPLYALSFVIIGGLLCPLLASLFVTPFLIHHVDDGSPLQTFRLHFAGSSLGILTVTPFLLSLFGFLRNRSVLIEVKTFIVNSVLLILTISGAFYVFYLQPGPAGFRYHFLIVPILIGLSLRGSTALTATSNMIFAFLVFFRTIQNQGAFLGSSDSLEALALVQMFIATTTFTHLLLTTIVRKRIQVTKALDEKSRELEIVNRELDQAKLAAIAASDAKSIFLANMSHEIRSPLSAMMGYAELMTMTSDKQESHAGVILRNGQHLLELVNQILDLAKIEAGEFTMNLGPVNIREMFSDVSELMQFKAHEKGLSLEIFIDENVPNEIETDGLRLKQILFNGIGNAIKFTHRGHIRARVNCAIDSGQRYRFRCELEDTGIGLERSECELLFQAFSQANKTISGEYGGTGLGLELSRRLARKLRGDYTLLRSERHKGSTFLLELDGGAICTNPVAIAKREVKVSSLIHRNHTQSTMLGLRLLIVDDAADNRYLLTRILQHKGASVESAENGKKALQLVSEKSFDLILMDIEMPELSGIDVVRQLRAGIFAGPIVALTGRALVQEIEECRAAGFNAHLIKPIDQNALETCVLALTRGIRKSSERNRKGARILRRVSDVYS